MKLVLLIPMLAIGCGTKATKTSCDSVGEHLAVLHAGRLANFMTETERKSRAKQWSETCEPLTDAQRKCVLASSTKEDADACTGTSGSGGSARTPNTDASRAKWLFRARNDGGVVSQLVIAADGDVIAAGHFNRKLVLDEKHTLDVKAKDVFTAENSVWVARLSPAGEVRWARTVGGVGDRREVSQLWSTTDGTIVMDIASNTAPHYARTTVAADGSAETVTDLRLDSDRIVATALRADGVVVSGALGAKDPCGSSTFPVHQIDRKRATAWSACSDVSSDTESAGSQYLVVSADGRTTLCGKYLGPAPTWGGSKGPETIPGTQSFVVSFGSDGKHRWTQYVTSPNYGRCEGLAATGDGVAAIIYGEKPKHGIVTWKSDGTAGWAKECDELLAGDGECAVTAITSHDSDIIVAVQNGGRTAISRLDAKSGATKKTHVFEDGQKIYVLAATATTVVFGTSLYAEADFGTGALTPTNPDSRTGDVVIGAH